MMCQKISRFRLKVLSLLGAGTLFAAVPGCDPDVTNIFVDGFESASVAVVQGLFEMITQDVGGETDGTVPTVMLDSWNTMRA